MLVIKSHKFSDIWLILVELRLNLIKLYLQYQQKIVEFSNKLEKVKNKKNPNSTLRENIWNWKVSIDVSLDNKN